jgi:hypothetical protein
VCVSAQSENCYLLTRDFSDCGACSVGFCPSCGQSVSNVDGSTIGGYLMSGQVFTTLELVLGTIDGVDFDREHDPRTGISRIGGFALRNEKYRIKTKSAMDRESTHHLSCSRCFWVWK